MHSRPIRDSHNFPVVIIGLNANFLEAFPTGSLFKDGARSVPISASFLFSQFMEVSKHFLSTHHAGMALVHDLLFGSCSK
jgi:hypothetical protein